MVDSPDRLAATRSLAQRIRRDCLIMTHDAGAGHIGSALSMVDVVAVLYGAVMRLDPADPAAPDRNRFILSKGHGGSAVLAALAECGFIDRDELLARYTADGTVYSGHISHHVPGAELTAGSLGQGVGVAAGRAFAAKIRGASWRTFCIVGDGECDEGSVWETALFAATERLDNFCVVVDRNHLQSFGDTERTALTLGDVAEKFRSFGWAAVDVDGHDHAALHAALSAPHPGRPLCVVAHTTKGKGVSFMEGDNRYHYDPATDEELERALAEVDGQAAGFPAGSSLAEARTAGECAAAEARAAGEGAAAEDADPRAVAERGGEVS